MGFVKVFTYLDTFKFEGSFWSVGFARYGFMKPYPPRKNQFVVFDDWVYDRITKHSWGGIQDMILKGNYNAW